MNVDYLTINVAIEELVDKFDDVARAAIRDDKYYLVRLQRILGQALRNELSLWEQEEENKSHLVKSFNALGIYHADDMSGILLDSVGRLIRNENIDLAGQIQYYRNYWKSIGEDPDNLFGEK